MSSEREGLRESAWLLTVALCIGVAVLEGLDIQAIGVAAPRLFPLLGVKPAQAGLIFSASTLGLAFGAMAGGRLADLLGRKYVLIGAVSIFGVLSLVTPLTHSLASLELVRFLTGLGLGGAMPNLIALVSENSPPRWRVSIVTIMWAGTPLGGIVAAQIAVATGDHWQTIFYAGGLLPMLLVPAMLALLPESVSFARLRATHAADRAPALGAADALFGGGRAGTTMLIWISYFCIQMILYLLLNWLPLLMGAQGFSHAQSAFSATAYNAGGVMGGVGFGLLLGFARRRWLLGVVFAGMAAGLLGLAVAGSSLSLSLVWALVCGLFVIGGQYVLYGVTPEIYPVAGRGTGVGAAVSIGRLGSVVGPIMAGQLLSLHVAVPRLLTGLLPLVAVAAIAILLVESIRVRRAGTAGMVGV